jgi:hypothetical protein
VAGGSLQSLGPAADAATAVYGAASPPGSSGSVVADSADPTALPTTPGDPLGVLTVDGVDGGSVPVLVLPTPAPTTPAQGATSSAAPGPTAGAAPVVVLRGGFSIPAAVLHAYARATAALATAEPACHLRWQLLAAIGRIESDHARGGDLDATGRTRHLIVGPELDGAPGVAAIRDTDHGRWDGDTVWDRAVGPMQFIPTTWAALGRDGNGDGVADPSNVYDATVSAAWYLCGYGRDLSRPRDLLQAVHGYNHSDAYVAIVLAWMQAYTDGTVTTTGSVPPTSAPSPSPTPTPSPSATATPAPTSLPTLVRPTGLPGPTGPGCPSDSSSDSPSGSPSDSPSDTVSATPTSSSCPSPSPSESADAEASQTSGGQP